MVDDHPVLTIPNEGKAIARWHSLGFPVLDICERVVAGVDGGIAVDADQLTLGVRGRGAWACCTSAPAPPRQHYPVHITGRHARTPGRHRGYSGMSQGDGGTGLAWKEIEPATAPKDHLARRIPHGGPVQVSEVRQDRVEAWKLLRSAHGKGQLGLRARSMRRPGDEWFPRPRKSGCVSADSTRCEGNALRTARRPTRSSPPVFGTAHAEIQARTGRTGGKSSFQPLEQETRR
jgi:hypothetical protein